MAKKLTLVDRVWTQQPTTLVGTKVDGAVISARDNAVIVGRNRFVPPVSWTLSRISGLLGSAYKATTESQRINFTIPPINIGTGDFTLSFLYRVTTPLASGYHYLFGTNINYLAFAPRHAAAGGDALLYCGSNQIPLGLNLSAVGTYRVVVVRRGTSLTIIANNQTFSTTNSSSLGAINTLTLNCYASSETGFGIPEAEIYLAGIDARAWSDGEVRAFINNPWQIFEPEEIPLFKPTGTGPVTHPTSGDVVGNSATITGSALRETGAQTHPSTGDVVGNTATVSGTALRYRAHATTGVVAGLTSNVTGTALRYRLHTTTGAITGLTSTVTGSAVNEPAAGVHEVTGDVVAGVGTVTGSALHIGVHRTTGVVAGYQGAVTGTAKNYTVHETTGVLSGFSAEVVGAAQRSGAVIVHSTSGVLAGYDSVVTGAATNMGGMTLTPADIQAIVAAIKAEIMPVNIVRVNNIDVDGTGADSDPWGPV
jgi:hypothetical protein